GAVAFCWCLFSAARRLALSLRFPYTTLFRSLARTSGSVMPPTPALRFTIVVLTPSRARAWPSSSPITPAPTTITLPGRSFQLKRSEEHTSGLQSRENLVCRRLLEKKKRQHAT